MTAKSVFFCCGFAWSILTKSASSALHLGPLLGLLWFSRGASSKSRFCVATSVPFLLPCRASIYARLQFVRFGQFCFPDLITTVCVDVPCKFRLFSAFASTHRDGVRGLDVLPRSAALATCIAFSGSPGLSWPPEAGGPKIGTGAAKIPSSLLYKFLLWRCDFPA